MYLHSAASDSPFDPNDPEALEKARRYSREQVKLTLLSSAWGLGLGATQIALGTPRSLGRSVDRRVKGRLRTPAFILAWSLQDWLLSLPLSYYSGYIVEKKYGLTNHTPPSWVAERLKGLAVSMALNIPTTTGFLWIVRRYPSRWWLAVSGLALPFTLLMTGLYPVLIAPLFNKYEPIGDPALEERIRALAEGEGVHVSRVLKMDMSRQTSKANAYFAGVGRSKRIVLADTLLEGFSPEEVEVVVAHELGHQVHRDLLKLVALSGLGTFGALYGLHRVFPAVARRTESRTGASSLGDVRAQPVMSLLAGTFGLLVTPLLNAYVRRMERKADAYAVRLTRNPRAFIGSMRGLQRTNLADPDPPVLVRLLLHSHPTIGERVRWAEAQLGADTVSTQPA